MYNLYLRKFSKTNKQDFSSCTNGRQFCQIDKTKTQNVNGLMQGLYTPLYVNFLTRTEQRNLSLLSAIPEDGKQPVVTLKLKVVRVVEGEWGLWGGSIARNGISAA